uniref:Mucolipin extracytosolic domain-containing protein n=1 Tax=Ciona savignyi TaxID=51511 RepID=H2YV81_CIOSA
MSARREAILDSTAVFQNSVNMSTNSSRTQERLRKELKYFFMNPCQKFKLRKRKPFKLTIQICKIAFVTIQLVIFGQHNQNRVAFMDDNISVFRNNLMNNESRLYTKDEVYSKINFLRQQYVKLKNSSVGIYGYLQEQPTTDCPDAHPSLASFDSDKLIGSNYMTPPIYMCVDQYMVTHLDKNETFQYDPKSRKKTCFFLKRWAAKEGTTLLNQSIPLCN